MNIQAQIALSEQLTNAFKEIERLQNELLKANALICNAKHWEDYQKNRADGLVELLKYHRIEIPKDLDCPF